MIPNDAPPVGRIRRRRRPILVAIAAVAAVALIAVGAIAYVLNRGPDHHADGAGPLSSLGPGTKIGNAVDPTASDRVTFGVELCLLSAEDQAVIETVEPSATVGTGFRFLGSLVRTFDPEPGVDSPHEPIGSVDGFPPSSKFAPDHLSDAVGYAVQVRCRHDQPPQTYTELLLGFERTDDTGGGWHGIDVGYAYAGRHRFVSLAYDFCFLGSLVTNDCTVAGG
jgi:hypothetical protein